MIRFLSCFLFALVCAGGLQARDAENFFIQLDGFAWLPTSSGSIRSSGSTVDFRSDLNASTPSALFVGRLIIKPTRRQRILVEGTPYSLNGQNQLNRSFTFAGRTYNVTDNVTSDATLSYFYAGYQYDVIHRTHGHFGLNVGGAYLGATAGIAESQLGFSSRQQEKVGLPLVGADFRISPIPGLRFFEIAGEAKGMALGDYGQYVQAQGTAGLRFGLLTFSGGYRYVDADVHGGNQNSTGVTPRFKGPVVGLTFRY